MDGKANKGQRSEQYSAPKLIKYGDMAKFTKGGSGSVAEAGSSNSMQKQ